MHPYLVNFRRQGQTKVRRRYTYVYVCLRVCMLYEAIQNVSYFSPTPMLLLLLLLLNVGHNYK